MALLTVETGSPTLRMTTTVNIISPVDAGTGSGGTLYLLHGAGDNASTWHRLTTAELYASQYGCTVIMPQVGRSYYTDMEYGLDYFRYITQELPEFCARLLNLETDPQKTFIAGLSMGGYGALKCALTYPERYSKVVSLSGVTDLQKRLNDPHMGPEMSREMMGVFGNGLQVKPDQDIRALADKLVKDNRALPAILTCCGSEDPFAEMNRDFASYMETTPYDFRYVETPGMHEWRFWERHLKTTFDFLYN
ncbi:alpha/beta hydrolase [Paenibacillus agri]|uniref:Alpha/beta fold hydrolase n=1 Tax=Paenibacillus agri TaxID=2744309 RepID=A0A850EGD8_9BACL|nr:alpha/beta hydrolase family protein [Paenibacillus agri]NUU60393.1 alpha/beta fold hydrolase [Paenibacillus agri]